LRLVLLISDEALILYRKEFFIMFLKEICTIELEPLEEGVFSPTPQWVMVLSEVY